MLIQRQRRQPRKAAADRDTGAEPDDAAARVDAFSDVRLTRFERLPSRHQYVGFGRDADGRKVVLIVTVPVAHGAPVPDEASSMGVVHSVTFVLADADDAEEQFDELWDIAFD